MCDLDRTFCPPRNAESDPTEDAHKTQDAADAKGEDGAVAATAVANAAADDDDEQDDGDFGTDEEEDGDDDDDDGSGSDDEDDLAAVDPDEVDAAGILAADKDTGRPLTRAQLRQAAIEAARSREPPRAVKRVRRDDESEGEAEVDF